ncbi:hypothetical protein C8R44DRAFT_892849 [Mycena epipterygia]|nr:hypothetical protein C8R44DRAFT_892849 [Mycena epipterygia]
MSSIMIHLQRGELFYDICCAVDGNFHLKQNYGPDIPQPFRASTVQEDVDDDDIPDLVDMDDDDDDPAPCCRHCRHCYPPLKTKL